MSENVKTIAYFCSEFALAEGVSTYAGGLGVLAGETVIGAGKRTDMRFYALGLLSQGPKTPEEGGFELMKESVQVPFGEREIKVAVWKKMYGSATLLLLDPNVPENAPQDQQISTKLYGGADPKDLIFQGMILGIGGLRLLKKLGIIPDIFHCNEGHTGFAALAALVESGEPALEKALAIFRNKIIGTKHTILSLSDTYVSRADFSQLLEPYIKKAGYDSNQIYSRGQLETNADVFSMTRFLLAVAGKANAVSVAHMDAEKARFPQSKLVAVTNGILLERWQPGVFNTQKEWRENDEVLKNIKAGLRRDLVNYVNEFTGSNLSPDKLTLVWARRFVAYKRPTLLLKNMQALLELIHSQSVPMQIIVSGKAHLNDPEGSQALNQWQDIAGDDWFKNSIAYLPQYSLESAQLLTKGADIWLNTPVPGLEACGTSGMKAGSTGALLVSTKDGWVVEVPEFSQIGFLVEEENIERALYDLLQKKIAPLFGTKEWFARMRQTISLIEKRFTISRMLDDYMTKMYSV